MVNVLLFILQLILSFAVNLISKVPPEDWAKLGDTIVKFLTNLQSKVAKNNPAMVHFIAFDGDASKLVK